MSQLGVGCRSMQEGSRDSRRVGIATIGLALALGCLLAPSALGAKKPKKVKDTTTWLCKPGIPNNPCEPGFDTTLISPSGQIVGTQSVKPDRKRKFDCFYVYPTVSDDKSAELRSFDRPGGALDRALSGGPLQPALPRLRADVPAGHARSDPQRRLDPSRRAADRLRRRPCRLEDLPAQVQPGPRRRPHRPLPGHLRAARAHPPGSSIRRRRSASSSSRRSCSVAT